MANQKEAAVYSDRTWIAGRGGIDFLGGFGSCPFCIFILLRFWKNHVSCCFGLFGRTVVVEKNMLCYNQDMGKRRRSKEFKNNSQVIDMEQARRQRLEKRRAEREKEEAKAKESARQKTRGKMAIRRNRNRRRLMIGIVVMVIIGLISFTVINIISLKKEQHDMKEQKQELQDEKEQLEKELEQANDLKNLEEQARDQLRLIKPGETIYIFPDDITKPDKDAEDTEE